MYNLIDILLENGFRVHFFPNSNQAIDGDYTFNLQKKGVNCLYHPTFKNIDDIEQSIGIFQSCSSDPFINCRRII